MSVMIMVQVRIEIIKSDINPSTMAFESMESGKCGRKTKKLKELENEEFKRKTKIGVLACIAAIGLISVFIYVVSQTDLENVYLQELRVRVMNQFFFCNLLPIFCIKRTKAMCKFCKKRLAKIFGVSPPSVQPINQAPGFYT